jgi:protein-L-isoaspartate(D-aspartate) O-methyltransferase
MVDESMLGAMAPTREGLVAELRRHVSDDRVLAAIAAVPRDAFVPRERRRSAWANEALPIGGGPDDLPAARRRAHGRAARAAPRRPRARRGDGSGYHAAVLARLEAHVWSIERDAALSGRAAENLAAAGVSGVELVVGDGTLGHPPAAPYDAINVAASAQGDVPPALVEQLGPGGRLVIPVGERLVLVRREPDGTVRREDAGGVRFVPLVPGDAA